MLLRVRRPRPCTRRGIALRPPQDVDRPTRCDAPDSGDQGGSPGQSRLSEMGAIPARVHVNSATLTRVSPYQTPRFNLLQRCLRKDPSKCACPRKSLETLDTRLALWYNWTSFIVAHIDTLFYPSHETVAHGVGVTYGKVNDASSADAALSERQAASALSFPSSGVEAGQRADCAFGWQGRRHGRVRTSK
jgi:hypothetical protein